MTKTIGIAGVGAIGAAVAKAVLEGVQGFELVAISDPSPSLDIDVPDVSFAALCEMSDMVIECLPPIEVPTLAKEAFAQNKDLILISSSAALLYPEMLGWYKNSSGQLIVPSGALAGLDGIKGLKELGLLKTNIRTTKKPSGFEGAPYIVQNEINLAKIKNKTCLFEGNALEAAAGFPANVNVAATLSLAGLGPENTYVEIWADPDIRGNTHEIRAESAYSTMEVTITNTPDPNNPKSSMLAAQSIVRLLKDQTEALVVL